MARSLWISIIYGDHWSGDRGEYCTVFDKKARRHYKINSMISHITTVTYDVLHSFFCLFGFNFKIRFKCNKLFFLNYNLKYFNFNLFHIITVGFLKNERRKPICVLEKKKCSMHFFRVRTEIDSLNSIHFFITLWRSPRDIYVTRGGQGLLLLPRKYVWSDKRLSFLYPEKIR